LVNKNAAAVAERLMTIFTQFGSMYRTSINDKMISPDELQL
jgi:hypothetical protein